MGIVNTFTKDHSTKQTALALKYDAVQADNVTIDLITERGRADKLPNYKNELQSQDLVQKKPAPSAFFPK